MDRRLVYPGANPQDLDILQPQQNSMVALAKLAEAVFGLGNVVVGLECTPTAPASLQVQVAPGQIYMASALEATPYGTVDADTAHVILKQGLLMDTFIGNCPAPGTPGYSINYLIQAAFQEVDTDATVLSYYNSANPQQSYAGPNNNGQAQNVTRKGKCVISVKVGVAAATGAQATPAADAGCVGLYVVTVANGQANINAGHIVAVVGAPNSAVADSKKLGGVLAASYASKTYVDTAIANLIDSAPGTLNTLNELAAALGDDNNFATAVTNHLTTLDNEMSTHTHPYLGLTAAVGQDIPVNAPTVFNVPEGDYVVIVDYNSFQGGNVAVVLSITVNGVTKTIVNSVINFQVAFGGSVKIKLTGVSVITVTPTFTNLDKLQCDVTVLKVG